MRRLSEVLNNDNGGSAAPVKKIFSLSRTWRSATTKNIARVTTPVKISGGALLVLVHDNIWFTELNYMKEEIVKRLNEYGLSVKTVNFRNCLSFVKYEKPEKELNKITGREIFYIEKFSAVIDNRELKNSFEKAMRAYFTRHTFEEFINGNI